MINIHAIRDLTPSRILWNRVEKNAKLTNNPRGDFFKAQFDTTTEILRDEVRQ